jgi:phage FluMu protein Com
VPVFFLLKMNIIFNISTINLADTNPPSTTPPPDGNPEDPNRVHCACGSLLARRVADGIELKCKRCKRILIVPITDDDSQTTDGSRL